MLKKPSKTDDQIVAFGKPDLSVIVPVYNSSNELEKCLSALSKSSYKTFEVLVVDDGSTESIEPIVRKYGYNYMRIKGPGGPARARNRGVERSSFEYVVFIDADVCVHENTLSLFAERFMSDDSLAAVIGSYDETPADRSYLSQYKNLFHHYVHQKSDGRINTFWSGCGAMRRDVFLKLGGFDEKRYNHPAIEDIELGTWVSAAGNKIVLDSRIKATHLKRWTLYGLLKTDIFDRGIPWTRLMLRAGAIANTLNVKHTQRISVALAYLTLFALLLGILWTNAFFIAMLSALAVTVLNIDFYRFFFKRSGLWFTLRVIPLHWLYFIYCGFCFVIGTFIYYLIDSRSPRYPLQANTLGE